MMNTTVLETCRGI